MSKAQNRILNELKNINKNPIEGFTITNCDDIMNIEGIMDGPIDTPYETGKFKIRFRFPDTYPFNAPSVQFLNYIFHPNIYSDGKICIDILYGEWSAAQNISSIVQSLRSLFMDPNPNSPANRKAAELYVRNKEEYNAMVIKHINEIYKEN